MRYSAVLLATFVAFVAARPQDDDSAIDDLVDGAEDIVGEVATVIEEEGGELLEDATEGAVDAIETILEDSDEEDTETETEVETETETETEVVDPEETEDAGSAVAVPVVGAAIAGVVGLVGML